MKAACYHGKRDVRVDSIPEPKVRPGTVKVRIRWCGLCGSDLAEYVYGPLAIPSEKPHPLTGDVMPVVIGHEFAGDVAEVGAGVEGIGIGDRVVIEPLIRCGRCTHCAAGRYNLCEQLAVHGLSGGGGGLAEYTVVPGYTIHQMPEEMDYETAATVEPLAVAIRSVDRMGAKGGDRVVVLGAGPIGLLIVATLRRLGVAEIVAVEPGVERRGLARRLGATSIAEPGEFEERLRAGEAGSFDAAIDSAGAPAALNAAVLACRNGGIVLCVSRYKKPAMLDPNQFRAEITLVSTQAYCGEFAAAIEGIASGRFEIGDVVTKRIDLHDVVEEGFESLASPTVKEAKILVRCSSEDG